MQIKQEIKDEPHEGATSEAEWDSVEHLPYFHRGLDRTLSVQLLGNCPARTFLVRPSDEAGVLSLSVRSSHSVVHIHIFRNHAGLFYLEAPPSLRMHFTTLDALISFHRYGQMIATGKQDQLTGNVLELGFPLYVAEASPVYSDQQTFLAQVMGQFISPTFQQPVQ